MSLIRADLTWIFSEAICPQLESILSQEAKTSAKVAVSMSYSLMHLVT